MFYAYYWGPNTLKETYYAIDFCCLECWVLGLKQFEEKRMGLELMDVVCLN